MDRPSFAAVFDLSSVGMIWATPEGRIIRANPSMARLMGYSVDELKNMPYEDLLPPEDRGEYHRILSEETQSGKVPKDRERRYLRKDGTIVWGLRSATPVRSFSGRLLPKLIIIQDITERKQAQEELVAEVERRREIEASLNVNETRLRDFAEVGSDLLWETDEEFRITSVIGDPRAVLGLPEEDMIGRTFWELADADLTDAQWKRHVSDHQAWRPYRNFEYQIIDQRGVRRWISSDGRPFRDQNGELAGYRGASTNIAARKHAKMKLAASARQQQSTTVLSQLALQRVAREELYQVAVELVARTLDVEITGILELSEDRRVLRLRAGVGWPPQSLNIRAVPVDFCPPLARGINSDVPVHFSRRTFNLVPGMQDVSGAGMAVPIGEASVRSGVLVVCSNGVRAFSESDANFLRAISFVLAADAEQRRAEATLKLRDRALEAAGQGIMITDATALDNPIIYVNPAFERITGYAREDAVGRNGRFLQGSETDESALRAIRAAVEGERMYKGTILNYRKDGSTFWNALVISPILDRNGMTSHYVGTVSDETERIGLESQLRQAQKMESLGHLTGGIAHDFNNLLAVILGNAEILCEEISDPTMKETSELIMTAAEKGAHLTERLLAFGRRQALHPDTLDLGEAANSLLEMLRRTIGDHITFRTRMNADRPAYVDRSLFESAVLNLALNARDAMPDGGVLTITADMVDAADAGVSDLQPGQFVRVCVTDTGVGMTPEVADRAFDPFFTTKSGSQGSGMGLSMVYGFAKQSGGHVVIESRVGHGTSVHLFLPVAQVDQTARESAKPAVSHAVARGSERILLVEDEPQLRRFVRSQLVGLGYDVIETGEGAAALDILRSETSINLLFTDLVMPGGMTGFDLVRKARELAPDLKVLLTTGHAAVDERRIADIREPILKKPYKKQELAQALRGVLDCAA